MVDLYILVIPLICEIEIIIFVYSFFVKDVQNKSKFLSTTLIIDFLLRISNLYINVIDYNDWVRICVESFDNYEYKYYEYLWGSGCLLAASIVFSLVLILPLIASFSGLNKKSSNNLIFAHLLCVISASVILVSLSLKNYTSECIFLFIYCLSSLLNAIGLMIYKKKYKKAALLNKQTPCSTEKSIDSPKNNIPEIDVSEKIKKPDQVEVPGISLLSDDEVKDIKILLINKIITLDEYYAMVELKVLEKRFLNNEISETEYVSKVNELNN